MGLFKDNKLLVRLFTGIKNWKNQNDELENGYEEDDWEKIEYDRDDLDIHDKEQRREYVKSCLEQIAEATKELENLNFEYGMVTSYLKDMEEIEALPVEEKEELAECAKKISELEDQRGVYLEKKSRLKDEKFHQMERMEEEAEEACQKLAEAEKYQELIRQDLTRLDGEKHAYFYQKSELQQLIADLKGVTIICSVALIVCFVVLFILEITLKMDIQLACLVTAAIGAIGITVLYLKYSESCKELKRVENGINRLIMLQNKVKIRYVNNVNLLDYLYLKYQVSSAKDIRTTWEKYKVEKEERKKYRQAELELDDCQRDLLNLLKCYQIKDPAIWLHQAEAIMDSKEMVEIRHKLIIRRQSLRRRIDYNKEIIASKAQKEIKDLVDSYPQYAKEIVEIVGEYERDFS